MRYRLRFFTGIPIQFSTAVVAPYNEFLLSKSIEHSVSIFELIGSSPCQSLKLGGNLLRISNF